MLKLCPYPFSRMQTSNYGERFSSIDGSFIPCVPSWFTQEYFKIKREVRLKDIWNGTAAQELRRRMYIGDFSFCDRKACQIPLFSIDELSSKDILFNETPIPPENLEAIKNKNPIMPNNPSSLYLTSDYTCNLMCPICRSKRVTNEQSPTKAALEEFDYVFHIKDSLEVIKFANGGEVFYSKLQRKLLKSLSNNDFPKLSRIHIVSNGTLFNEKAYKELSPGTKFIKDVNISLDAASKNIYEVVRGPHYNEVMKNIKWLGQLRKKNQLDYYSFHIIIVKNNFRDLPNILKLARDNYVDRVLLQPFLDNEHKQYSYKEQAVHLPEHPNYQEFINLLLEHKDDPLLYSYFDIPGMNDKIEKDVLISKSLLTYKQGHAAFLNKNYEKAIELLEQANEFHEEYYIHYEIGDIYRFQNKYEDAITSYKKALDLKPNYFASFFALAVTYNELKDFKLSLKYAEKAANLEPDNKDILKYLKYIKGQV